MKRRNAYGDFFLKKVLFIALYRVGVTTTIHHFKPRQLVRPKVQTSLQESLNRYKRCNQQTSNLKSNYAYLELKENVSGGFQSRVYKQEKRHYLKEEGGLFSGVLEDAGPKSFLWSSRGVNGLCVPTVLKAFRASLMISALVFCLDIEGR